MDYDTTYKFIQHHWCNARETFAYLLHHDLHMPHYLCLSHSGHTHKKQKRTKITNCMLSIIVSQLLFSLYRLVYICIVFMSGRRIFDHSIQFFRQYLYSLIRGPSVVSGATCVRSFQKRLRTFFAVADPTQVVRTGLSWSFFPPGHWQRTLLQLYLHS